MIDSITIKNIKGFDSEGKTLAFNLMPKKFNICVAPNGFGKSSIATAIKILENNPNKLEVKKTDAYQNNDAVKPEITLTIDSVPYLANQEKNDIKGKIICHILSSKLDVSTTQRNMGKFTHVEGILDISDIEVYSKIPEKLEWAYKYTDSKKTFGKNGKILINHTNLFNSWRFTRLINKDEVKAVLKHLSSLKSTQDNINTLQSACNSFNLTADEIRQNLNNDDNLFQEFLDLEDVKFLIREFSPLLELDSNFAKFDFIWQLLQLYKINSKNINKIYLRKSYEQFAQMLSGKLSDLNTTWRPLDLKEENGVLKIKFPNANQISNGQRDFLTFISEMTKVKHEISLNPNKPHLIVIDELFDYLDDANMIAVQSELSRGLFREGIDIYTCILTHLSPEHFRSYIFSPKKMNVIYLDESSPRATDDFLSFISWRSELNPKDAIEGPIYNDVSSHLFHYHPDESFDASQYYKDRPRPHVKSSWGKVKDLKDALINEINNYLTDAPTYDPYAVCMALRHRVEKVLFKRLEGDNIKEQEFLSAHKTIDKIAVIEKYGIDIPESFNLITALHNEADHVKLDKEKLGYIEKPIVYKLRHLVIKNLIAKIFDFKGEPLHKESIL